MARTDVVVGQQNLLRLPDVCLVTKPCFSNWTATSALHNSYLKVSLKVPSSDHVDYTCSGQPEYTKLHVLTNDLPSFHHYVTQL